MDRCLHAMLRKRHLSCGSRAALCNVALQRQPLPCEQHLSGLHAVTALPQADDAFGSDVHNAQRPTRSCSRALARSRRLPARYPTGSFWDLYLRSVLHPFYQSQLHRRTYMLPATLPLPRREGGGGGVPAITHAPPHRHSGILPHTATTPRSWPALPVYTHCYCTAFMLCLPCLTPLYCHTFSCLPDAYGLPHPTFYDSGYISSIPHRHSISFFYPGCGLHGHCGLCARFGFYLCAPRSCARFGTRGCTRCTVHPHLVLQSILSGPCRVLPLLPYTVPHRASATGFCHTHHACLPPGGGSCYLCLPPLPTFSRLFALLCPWVLGSTFLCYILPCTPATLPVFSCCACHSSPVHSPPAVPTTSLCLTFYHTPYHLPGG